MSILVNTIQTKASYYTNILDIVQRGGDDAVSTLDALAQTVMEVNWEVTDAAGRTALMLACVNGHVSVVSKLLQLPVQLEAVNQVRYSM